MNQELTVDAVRAADAAAAAAGVSIREIGGLAELEAVYRLYDSIWRPDPKDPPVTTTLLRALAKSGNYVAAAFESDELVGASVGFLGSAAGELELHSHIAGVSSRALGRSVGYALKLHQRAWALGHDVTVVEWTYDPLVRRNAYFNLAKLGAVPVEYLPNFYGGMQDTINAGDESDRLLARWVLDAPAVVAASHGRPVTRDAEQEPGAVIALDRADDGTPVVGPLDGETLLVAVPPDFEALRASDPAVARQWRLGVRETLGTAMTAGARVVGFDRAGWYVLSTMDGGAR
jgi:predicted GNAT superfamily acetyltransferase